MHFDFGKEKNEEYLKNDNKFEELKNQLKEKIAKDYNISKDKIVVFSYRKRGCLAVQIIFQSDEFNNLDLKEFESKFKNDKNFPELQRLKEIHEEVVRGGIKFTKNDFDSEGNRISGWGVGEKRGGRDYYPPIGWTGIGLKAKGKYNNDVWIGMNNSDGEWCVAYHGVGRGQPSEKVKQITELIYKSSFKPGEGQFHAHCKDKYHPKNFVGEGVYCATHIETVEGKKYSGISEFSGKRYKTVLMVRVKPDATRGCNCSDSKDYYVVNGTPDEIRPYRILYKREK